VSQAVSKADLFALVDEREDAVRSFLLWARDAEQEAIDAGKPWWSLRLETRQDITDAAEAAKHFREPWWGIVVFTAFGSKIGAETVAPAFQRPLPEEAAWQALDHITFPRRSVGHHRIQPGVKGAKKALVAASAHQEFFYEVLHGRERSFESRYWQLREQHLPQWGRTTTFDLLLRAGALGIGGERYAPTIAHLAGSTGPKAGFKKVWGKKITTENAEWGEALLQAWNQNWFEVAKRVGLDWDVGAPFDPGAFENALCIYQERRRQLD
jgi:hypothetical protein